MSIRETINNELSKWMLAPGPDSDIVISSRVRLARNIDGIPFPNRASSEYSQQVFSKLDEALQDHSKFDLKLLDLNKVPDLDKEVMKEKYLISPQ